MDIEQYKKEVSAINWHEFTGYKYYEPDSVPTALISLALAQNISTSRNLLINEKVTNYLLHTIGNNHSGTYYSVVKKALPFIIQVALFGNHVVARNCAIDALIDLDCFYPDAEEVSSEESEELLQFVRTTIERTILENNEYFIKIASNDIRNKSMIEDLIGLLENEPD